MTVLPEHAHTDFATNAFEALDELTVGGGDPADPLPAVLGLIQHVCEPDYQLQAELSKQLMDSQDDLAGVELLVDGPDKNQAYSNDQRMSLDKTSIVTSTGDKPLKTYANDNGAKLVQWVAALENNTAPQVLVTREDDSQQILEAVVQGDELKLINGVKSQGTSIKPSNKGFFNIFN